MQQGNPSDRNLSEEKKNHLFKGSRHFRHYMNIAFNGSLLTKTWLSKYIKNNNMLYHYMINKADNTLPVVPNLTPIIIIIYITSGPRIYNYSIFHWLRS